MDEVPNTPVGQRGPADDRAACPDPRTLRSEELLQGQVEVLIAHGAETYRLRLTRNGKLILQK